MKEKREQFNLRMPEPLKGRGKKEAAFYGINMSQFIVQAINEKLEKIDMRITD